MPGSIKKSFLERFSIKSCRSLTARSSGAGQHCTPSLSTRIAEMATLGISTNTRLLGLAIINQGRLVEYRVHLHKSSWSPSKANMIVTSLEPCVRQYSIKKIVLSIPHEHHQTPAFKTLILCIQEYCQAKGIPVISEPAEALYSFCQKGQKKTKKAMMYSLVQMFPELRHCYQKELRNKNKYYIKLFEAVAMATLHHQSK